ncbi:hypothetical protein ACFLZH_03380 [Patescibacteria group bacterium]
MASRDKYAVKFEEFIFSTIKEQELDPQDNDTHNIEVGCPCCKTGQVRMEISTRHSTVMAQCTNHGSEGKCGSQKVFMPYNVIPKSSMVENGIG